MRLLAAEAGIRQFLDVGTGLPTMGNVHEIAQEDLARFFDGLELVEPGLVNVTLWRPAPGSLQPSRPAGRSLIYGGVARKPDKP